MKAIHLICFLFICCFQQLFSYPCFGVKEKDLAAYIHEYVGHYIYEENSMPDYKGQEVIMLDDGSSWHVDPDDWQYLADWRAGDKVHVEPRTWLTFMYDYKLILVNHNKNSKIHAMLNDAPLTISYAGKSIATRRKKNWPFNDIYSDYRQNLTLSNSSLWEVRNNNASSPFLENNPAYIGYYECSEFDPEPNQTWIGFIMITGKGKNTTWCDVTAEEHRLYFDSWKED